VLRVDGHVVKLYAKQHEFEDALRGQCAASILRSVVAPRLEAALPERLLTVQSHLPGKSVSSAADVAAEAGALLARLHASGGYGLHVFEPAEQLAAAGASAQLVGTIAPELRSRLERLLGALEAARPEGAVLIPCHGDFNARQLIVTNGDLALTDFDAFCFAPAALDTATYAAHLVRGGPHDLDAALAVLDDLVQGYGERPAHLSWYLATTILRESPWPFRYLEPDWPLRVEAAVTSTEEALAL
jgi:aminoglycoside phosphotransferase (APT) family kinase protein